MKIFFHFCNLFKETPSCYNWKYYLIIFVNVVIDSFKSFHGVIYVTVVRENGNRLIINFVKTLEGVLFLCAIQMVSNLHFSQFSCKQKPFPKFFSFLIIFFFHFSTSRVSVTQSYYNFKTAKTENPIKWI